MSEIGRLEGEMENLEDELNEAHLVKEHIINKVAFCENCFSMYEHHYDQPFASCNCHTAECYEFSPYMKVRQIQLELFSMMDDAVKSLESWRDAHPSKANEKDNELIRKYYTDIKHLIGFK